MAEQAVWHLKGAALAIPFPSIAAIRSRAGMVGPPRLLGLLAAVIATQLEPRIWRGKAEVLLSTPHIPASLDVGLHGVPRSRDSEIQANLAFYTNLARSP